VCGDLLVLAEGDRVPADALLISCTNLTVDESLLTGESVPVRKVAGSLARDGAAGR
jgi:Ca2+-transporting ATPase